MNQFEGKSIDEIWELLDDIPVNLDGEIDEPFLNYPIGTEVTEIWTDIEYHYDISIGNMYFGKSLKS